MSGPRSLRMVDVPQNHASGASLSSTGQHNLHNNEDGTFINILEAKMDNSGLVEAAPESMEIFFAQTRPAVRDIVRAVGHLEPSCLHH